MVGPWMRSEGLDLGVEVGAVTMCCQFVLGNTSVTAGTRRKMSPSCAAG